MGDLEKIWAEVEKAVSEATASSNGPASKWYLEYAFMKAGLGVFRLPDIPGEETKS
jgi:hypothetical protein